MSLDPKKAQEYEKATQGAAKNVKSVADKSKDLEKNLREVLFLTRDYASEARNATKAIFESSEQASAAATAFKKVANVTRDIGTEMDDVLSGALSFEQASKKINQYEQARKSLMTEQKQALDKILATKMSEEQKEIAIGKAMESNAGLADVISDIRESLTEDEAYLLDLYQAQGEALDGMGDDVSDIANRAGNIDDAFGLAGGSAEGLDTVLKNLGGGKFSKMLGIEEAVGDTRQFAAQITKGGKNAAGMGGKFKVVGKLVQSLGKNLMKSLGPMALLAIAVQQVVEAFKLIDGLSGDVAKNFGISVQEADKLVKTANEQAVATGDIMISTKDIVAAQQELNNLFGTSVTFSQELAGEFAQIKERTGLSAEAVGRFAELAVLSGTSIKDQMQDVTAMTMQLKAETGIMLNQKQIQEGMAKMSKTALLSAKGNTREMANQVFQAKLLGVEQSKVEDIAGNLLNFESSIAAEMEAELLLGKNLNLEKAREAAMNNDYATVASEIAKQVGTAAEFGEMNALQQAAVAKAVGMTREELASALVEQEKLNAIQALGFKDMSDAQEQYNAMVAAGVEDEELKRKLEEAGLLNQFESVTRQDKMNAAVEKLQDLFVSLVEPLMPVIDILMQILDEALNPILQALTPMLQMFGELLSQILEPIASLLVGMIKPIFDAMLIPINIVKDTLDEVFGILGEVFGEGENINGIFEVIGEVLGTIVGIFIQPMLFGIRFITERIKAMANIFGGVIKIFQGDFEEGFRQIASGAIDFIIAPFQALADGIIGMINFIIKGINKIPGVSLSLIESPDLGGMIKDAVGLAEGGIVTAPTNAIVGEGGEPEAVVPLSKAPQFGFGGNEETNNLLRQLIAVISKGGNVYLDGNKVGKSLAIASSNMG